MHFKDHNNNLKQNKIIKLKLHFPVYIKKKKMDNKGDHRNQNEIKKKINTIGNQKK